MQNNKQSWFIGAIAVLAICLITSGWLPFFPSQLGWKWGLMLVLWVLQSVTIILLARRKRGEKAMLVRMLSMGLGIAWTLVTLGYVVASCAPDTGQMEVQTVQDKTTGARLEVYHTDQHDHIGVELFWGADAFPFASGHYSQDHFDVDSIAVRENGRIVLWSYFAPDSIELLLASGELRSSKVGPHTE